MLLISSPFISLIIFKISNLFVLLLAGLNLSLTQSPDNRTIQNFVEDYVNEYIGKYTVIAVTIYTLIKLRFKRVDIYY